MAIIGINGRLAMIAVIGMFAACRSRLASGTRLRRPASFARRSRTAFARLTTLVRVLRLRMFKELALLLSGIMNGLRILMWAM
eukprot:5356748-Heterocapsa_arctica.AAC.1